MCLTTGGHCPTSNLSPTRPRPAGGRATGTRSQIGYSVSEFRAAPRVNKRFFRGNQCIKLLLMMLERSLNTLNSLRYNGTSSLIARNDCITVFAPTVSLAFSTGDTAHMRTRDSAHGPRHGPAPAATAP